MKRNEVFDIAKFLAMWLVVLGHLLNERAGDPAFIINFFHMPTLFFISGWLASYSLERRTAGAVLKKKAERLLFPYIFWSGVSLLANAALAFRGGALSPEYLRREAVEIFFYARSVWFLIQLFAAFLLLLAVYEVRRRTEKVGRPIPLGAGCAAAWLLFSCVVPGEPFLFYKCKWLFPFFAAGFLLGRARERIPNKRYRAVEAASCLFPVLAAALFREEAFWKYVKFQYFTTGGGSLLSIFYYLISAFGVLFLLTLARWLSGCAAGRFCAEVGRYSMDIYVVHMFLIRLLPLPWDLHQVGSLMAHGLLLLPSLAVVLAIWALSKQVFRRVGLYRLAVGAE